MIPPFNQNGALPPGIYAATLPEIKARFATNSTRDALFAGLKLLAHDLAAAGCKTLYLNGSFITDKQDPKDYDACWETDGVDNRIDPILRDIKTFKQQRKQNTAATSSTVHQTSAPTFSPSFSSTATATRKE